MATRSTRLSRIRLLWSGGLPQDCLVENIPESLVLRDRRAPSCRVTFESTHDVDFDGSLVFAPVNIERET